MVLRKPFDVSLKNRMEELPDGWPALPGGWWPRQLRLIDADMATLTAAADKVFLLRKPRPTQRRDAGGRPFQGLSPRGS